MSDAKRSGAALVGFVGATLLLAGCGGDTSNAGKCSIEGCGGDIKGTWDVTAICGDIMAVPASTGIAACDDVEKQALSTAKYVPMDEQVQVTDSTFTITGGGSAQVHYVFTAACLMAQGGTAASATTCSGLQNGLMGGSTDVQSFTCTSSGDTCVCDMALGVMNIDESSPYHLEGNDLVIQSSGVHDTYCVKGDTAQMAIVTGGISGSYTLKRHQ